MGTRYFGGLGLILVCIGSLCFGVTGATNSKDVSALDIMRLLWGSTVPPNWVSGTDPCENQWDGVNCTDGRITSLKLSSLGLEGTLPNDIGSLTALDTLDLSYNTGLTARLPSTIGKLASLRVLMAIGCSFNGPIPAELGNLTNLSFLALNSNKFTGPIPPTLGKLVDLAWLDLADNQLTGSIPVSNTTQPGLDQLVNANHFHFNLNKLSGNIPAKLFSKNMTLLHLLFDSNEFEGGIPRSLGQVSSLMVVRLDRNRMTGFIPTNLTGLVNLEELNLSNNRFRGGMPDLSALNRLQYMDISNNPLFDPSIVPQWITSLQQLNTLVMDNCSISGQASSTILNIEALETIRMKDNQLSGPLNITPNPSSLLKWVDLRYNDITEVHKDGDVSLCGPLNITPNPSSLLKWVDLRYNDITEVHKDGDVSLWVAGNPVCNPGNLLSNSTSCQSVVPEDSYESNMAQCGDEKCRGTLKLNPRTCKCQQPYGGLLKFRAPSFSSLTDAQRFKGLEDSLKAKLAVDAVYLCCLHFDDTDYLIMSVNFFPVDTTYFTRLEVSQIGFTLSNQIYKPPEGFGPYFFIAERYITGSEERGSKGLSTAAIAVIAVAAAVLTLVIIMVGVYALRQKKRADRAIEIHKPFASWGAGSKDSGKGPKLKGARWFSFAEVKKATNNFSESNAIGSGGYGRVYKGKLPEGEMVAIKRAQQGSLQGGAEFNNEIELLSRVHHKNLVGLIGFCTEQREQMLIYEYVPNGTLRENLIGEFALEWARRLQIALGSAGGLNYLHELANPPIIHRDVKSSNILLDENLNAKVADFGLSKLVCDGGVDSGGKGHVSTQVKGTLGYLDPEYYMTQQLSEKSDVYSFGIVLLELITARLPIEGGKYIVRLVKEALESGGIEYLQEELMDPVLRQDNLKGFGEFFALALRCVEEMAAKRPSMREVVKELECIVDMEGSFQSTKISPESDNFDYKGTPKLYSEDEDGNSIVLPAQVDEGHIYMFDYSGAYLVSSTVEPK